jgi:hypothetical protein
MSNKTSHKKETPQTRTILVLVDFEGHQALGDTWTEQLRWSSLNELLFVQKKHQLVILSDHKRTIHHKMNSIQEMVIADKRHKWINIDSIEYPNVKTIERKLLQKRNTLVGHVVIGGTNTSGCVFTSKPWSVLKWVSEGHGVNMILPMCTEYQKPGTSPVEKNINAFGDLWRKTKELGCVEMVDMISDVSRAFSNPKLEITGE